MDILDRKKVKATREALGLTAAQAAKRAGFKFRQHWHNIEAGRVGSVTLDTLAAVARALGLKPKDLLK